MSKTNPEVMTNTSFRSISRRPMFPDLTLYCFVQLKLRRALKGSDVEKALATVSSNAVQGKMDKEYETLLKEQPQEHKKTNKKARVSQ